LGSFELPEGPGYGNGTGGAKGARGTIASAGFGSGVAGGGAGRGGGGRPGGAGVTTGDFDKTVQVGQSPAAQPRVPPSAEFQPVEIISKPSPVYTDEARRLGIQGEVALSVVFQASGTIRVVGVVKSLGHGLDQAAEQAATQIRFKPAQRSGQPTDFPATLRIEFRLADQVTKPEGKP
jgi:protein TonB